MSRCNLNQRHQFKIQKHIYNACKYSKHTCMVTSIHKYKEGVKEKCEQWRNNEQMHLEANTFDCKC